MNKIIIALICFLTYSISSIAQIEPCGTVTSPEVMKIFYNRDRSHLDNKATKSIVYIPITYHLVADNNGDGRFTMSELINLHCSLNSGFEDADVVFYINDIVTHNSSYYYYMQDSYAGDSMFLRRNVKNTCNIYLVKDAKSGSTPVCGYSYLAAYGGYLNKNGIMLSMSCSGLGSTTLTHEMGHYLNLPHTFAGWEGRDYNLNPINSYYWEKTDGSNCDTIGDGFCDTPPDYRSDRWSCLTSPTYLDPDGQTFITDEKNFMSYSVDGCQQYFKPQQQAEVNAAPANYRPYLLTLPTPNTTQVGSTQLISPVDNENNLSVANLPLSWEAVPGADYYLVQFTLTNFYNLWNEAVVTTNSMVISDLMENKTYRWRVKAFTYGNVCSDFTTHKSFTTSKFSATAVGSNVLCVGETNGSASVSSQNTAVNFVWYKLDSSNMSFDIISTSSSNSINNLSPGYYRVDVTDVNGFQSNSFFQINDIPEIAISIAQVGNVLVPTVVGGKQPYTYTWNNGSSTANNNNPGIGVNTLFITDVNGCFKSESFTFSQGNATSINNLGDSEFLLLYPNPVSGDLLNVKFSSSVPTETNFKLISISGNEISNQQQTISVGENLFQINVSGLAKGVYFLQFVHKDKMITRKVII